MKARKVGGKVGALASLFNGGLPSPTAPEHPHAPSQVETSWETFRSGSPSPPNASMSSPAAPPALSDAPLADAVEEDSTNNGSNAAADVSTSDIPPPDAALDESSVQEFYFQMLLNRSFTSFRNGWRRRTHLEVCEKRIRARSLRSVYARLFAPWRGKATRKAACKRRCAEFIAVRNEKERVGDISRQRLILVSWSMHARDCNRLIALRDSVFLRHQQVGMSQALRSWSGLCRLKTAVMDIMVRKIRQKLSHVLARWSRARAVKLWHQTAVACGRERTQKSQLAAILASWSGWIRHCEHLDYVEKGLIHTTTESMMRKMVGLWADWVMASKLGSRMMILRYVRKWHGYVVVQAAIHENGEAASRLHLRALQRDVVASWQRDIALSTAAMVACQQRFGRVFMAWCSETHSQARLKRIHASLSSRIRIKVLFRVLIAWSEYTRWCSSVEVLERGFSMEQAARQQSRVLRAWVQCSWKRRVLNRAEVMLRSKSSRLVKLSCFERWLDQTMQRQQESLIEQQKEDRMARSTTSMALTGWQRGVLYCKYLRLTQEKIAKKVRDALLRAIVKAWRSFNRASSLSRLFCVRDATRGWKKGAWASSCAHASEAVAGQLGMMKALRMSITSWSKHCQESRWCGSFRERQLLAGSIRLWLAWRSRVKKHHAAALILTRTFVVSKGSRRLAYLLSEWLMATRESRMLHEVISPMLGRMRSRLLHACHVWWFKRARRSKLKGMVQGQLMRERVMQMKRRVMNAWVKRTDLARAILETIIEAEQSRDVAAKGACFATWTRLRTYMIQLLSAAQYTEDVTAEYCKQKVVAEWRDLVKQRQQLSQIESQVHAKAAATHLRIHMAIWYDWIKACNADAERCIKCVLQLWKLQGALQVFMRSSKEVAKRKYDHYLKRAAIRAWHVLTAEHRDVCSVTRVWDKREAAIRRAAMTKLVRAWLQRTHRAAANRAVIEGLTIKYERQARVKVMHVWRLRVVTVMTHMENSVAVQLSGERRLCAWCVKEWGAVVRCKTMRNKLSRDVVKAHDKSLVVKSMAVWTAATRKELALETVLDAVLQMYSAKLVARVFKTWVVCAARCKSMAQAEHRMVHFVVGFAQRVAWCAWRQRVKVMARYADIVSSVGGKVRSKLLTQMVKAWRKLCKAQTKGNHRCLTGVLSEWAERSKWLAFFDQAIPMATRWRCEKVLRTTVREWCMSAMMQQRYGEILKTAMVNLRRRVLPACMRAWFVLASKSEILANASNMVSYKLSTGMRGKVFAKWREFAVQGSYFYQTFSMLSERHAMRVQRGCVRTWKDAVLHAVQKSAHLDAMEELQFKQTTERLVRLVRAWQQFVMTRIIQNHGLRMRLSRRVLPSFRSWLRFTTYTIRLKAAGNALVTAVDQLVVRRIMIEWRRVAPFLRLLWLGEIIISRRTTNGVIRTHLTHWARLVRACALSGVMCQRRVFRAWMKATARIKFCRHTAYTHSAPRRVGIMQKACRAWRLEKERVKYFGAAVDAMQQSLARRHVRKVLKGWSLHVGYVWPRRLASFSAANLADVRRRLQAYQVWAKYTAAKVTRHACIYAMVERREISITLVMMLLWARSAAIHRRVRRAKLSGVFSAWKLEAHIRTYWSRVTHRFAHTWEMNVWSTCFTEWWMWSARAALLRQAVLLLLDMHDVYSIGTSFHTWRRTWKSVRYLRKCHRIAGRFRRTALARNVLRMWKWTIDVRIGMRNLSTHMDSVRLKRALDNALGLWKQFARASRKYRRAKKYLRSAALKMPKAWVRRCFVDWSNLVRTKADLGAIGLNVLIRHNRALAAGGFRAWLAQTSVQLSSVSTFHKQQHASILARALREWSRRARRRFYGDFADHRTGSHHHTASNGRGRTYGDRDSEKKNAESESVRGARVQLFADDGRNGGGVAGIYPASSSAANHHKHGNEASSSVMDRSSNSVNSVVLPDPPTSPSQDSHSESGSLPPPISLEEAARMHVQRNRMQVQREQRSYGDGATGDVIGRRGARETGATARDGGSGVNRDKKEIVVKSVSEQRRGGERFASVLNGERTYGDRSSSAKQGGGGASQAAAILTAALMKRSTATTEARAPRQYGDAV